MSYNSKLREHKNLLQEILEDVNALPEAGNGVELPELTNEGTASDLLSGKQLINSEGNIVTGTIETKTESDLSSFGPTVAVPAGYYAERVQKAVTGATVATPSISINNSGLITASVTQTAGYVTYGTKSATKQLTVQAAQTITPGTTDKTIDSGKYLTGTQTIKGDANLKAENIVSGVSIFGVNGTATGGGVAIVDPFEPEVPYTYTVNALDDAPYGFVLNSDGYYEAQNKDINDSISACRINFVVESTCDIPIHIIHNSNLDPDVTYESYGAYLGNLDTSLDVLNNTIWDNNHKYLSQSSRDTVVKYNNVTPGNHFIDILFYSSKNAINELLLFKVKKEGPLPQTTIDKILAADTDLISENIKSGVDIFGVVGTYEADTNSIEDAFITKTFIGNNGIYENTRVTKVGHGVFQGCSSLTSVSFPACLSIGDTAFQSCTKLASATFPVCKSIGNNAFSQCDKLAVANFSACTSVGYTAFYSCSVLSVANFPVCKTLGYGAFSRCYLLTSVSLPVCTSISTCTFSRCSSLTTLSLPACTAINGTSAFANCTSLTALYLTGSTICSLANSNAFTAAGIKSNAGSIYVNASLVDAYKSATNWTYYSNRIFAYEGAIALNFTINNVAYQADEGMTWAEWCNSDYNTGGFYIDNNGYVYNGTYWVWDALATVAEVGTETITNQFAYSIDDIYDLGWE